MPLPKPRKSESRDEFIARCMGDGVMVREYPDAGQRRGVCQSQWDGKAAAAGRRWFEVRAAADGDVDLLIYGYIGGWEETDVSAKAVKLALAEHKTAKTIRVSINSPGGNAFDGMAIHNILAEHPARVEVTIDGIAFSAASIVAMAGDEIAMAANGLMLIHEPTAMVIGTSADMTRMAADLETITAGMVRLYASRSGQSEEQVAEWLAAETMFDAEEALELGFATRVKEAKKIAASWPREAFAAYRHVPADLVERLTQSAPAGGPSAMEQGRPGPSRRDRSPESMHGGIEMTDQGTGPAPDLAEMRKAAIDVGCSETRNALREMTSAFPGDLVFAVEEHLAGHTIEQAKAAYADVLGKRLAEREAELTKVRGEAAAASAALAEGGKGLPAGDEPGGQADFVAAARQRAKADGISLSEAMRALTAEDPAGHASWLDAQPRVRVRR